jgi:hypothetical protein
MHLLVFLVYLVFPVSGVVQHADATSCDPTGTDSSACSTLKDCNSVSDYDGKNPSFLPDLYRMTHDDA